MSINNTRQAAWVALGNFFTFSFGIVSAMILSRYFNKTEYGTYKQVFYIYNILLGMFTLGLPNAYSYFLARSPLNQAKNLIWKMTRLFMVLGLIMSIVLFVGASVIANIMRNPELKDMLMIFAPVPFLILPTIGLQNILVTFNSSRIIPFYVIITALTQLICVIGPVLIWNLGCQGALIGFNLSSLIAFCLAIYLNTYPIRNEGNEESKDTYKEIFKFAFPLFIATVWGTLINSTDQFYISRFFGTEVFADFSNGATDLPFVGMIVGATSAVLTPLFTREVKAGSNYTQIILPVWNSAFIKSAMLIYPITIFCIFDAETIMSVMYGDTYADSGAYFRIKLFTYFAKIISFYSLIIALGATKFYQKIFMYIFLSLVVIEYLVIYFFKNPLLIPATHVFFTIVSCFVFIKYIAYRFNVAILSLIPLKRLTSVVIISIISSLFFLLIEHFVISGLNNMLKLIIDLMVFAASYFAICSISKINYKEIILPLLKG